MSEIGRYHFLVATYEHMSLNATPTLAKTKGEPSIYILIITSNQKIKTNKL